MPSVTMLSKEDVPVERANRVTSLETIIHNVNVIALHIATCRNCTEKIQEDPTVQQHIDRYSTSHIQLTELDVHRTVYYHLCPVRLEGLMDEHGKPFGIYHGEEE